jgi:uncharacterized membrane protein (DUF2068 family)
MKKIRIIFRRVKALMLAPAKVWKAIAEENDTVKEIVMNILLPLSIVTVFASYIGYGIVGSKQDMFGLVASAKLGYRYATYYFFLQNTIVFALALAISFFAPFFDANRNFNRNLRLVVYSFTPSMAATLLLLVPVLAPLIIVAVFFNLMLLFAGLTRMTNVPVNKKWGYFFTIVAMAIFLFFAISKILSRIILD